MQGRSPIYITFCLVYWKLGLPVNEVPRTSLIVFLYVAIKIFLWNRGKKAALRFANSSNSPSPYIVRCDGRNSVRLNALIAVESVRPINNRTYSHRLLCTKMADAWANQLPTSPLERDENALLSFLKNFMKAPNLTNENYMYLTGNKFKNFIFD